MAINLLIVDDHAIVTDGLKALLADSQDYVVKGVATDGEMAIQMLEILKVDIALMDIDMPGMNGVEAVKIIKRDMPSVKVIMLTMHDEKGLIQMMMDIGADGYLIKNSPKSELVNAINAVAAGNTYFSKEVSERLSQAKKSEKKDSKLLANLTEREIEIIRLVAEGFSNKQIGEKLVISHRTVDTHRTNLMTKIEVHNVAGIVKFAIANGLISEE